MGKTKLEIKMKPPILITGAARSGTSMVAGIINLCGAYGGHMSPGNKYNEKGMFENHAIRQGVLKPYLRSINADPLGQYPLPKTANLTIQTDLNQRVEHIMQHEGYTSGPWMYKGAKMCLTWPAWHYAFPDAKWIIVRRKTSDIVNSCMHTGFMKAYSNPMIQKKVHVSSEAEGWKWWVRQHEKCFVEMIEAGMNIKIIWPERMLSGDYSQIYEMLEWLGLEWKKEIVDFIEPKLWKARQTKKQ